MQKIIKKFLVLLIFCMSVSFFQNNIVNAETIELEEAKPKTEEQLNNKQTVTNEIEKEAEEKKKKDENNFLKDSQKLGKESKTSSNLTNGSNLPKLPQEFDPSKKTDSTIKLKSSYDENGNRVIPDEKMQFLTVETRNGIKFHIIVDYAKNDKNVKFLTETSESDMLSIISQKEKIEKQLKAKKEAEEQLQKEQKEAELKKGQKKVLQILAIIIVILLIIGLIFYLIKIRKVNFKDFFRKKRTIDEG